MNPVQSKDIMTQMEKAGLQKALFAGGCFWCMEEPFESIPGIKAVLSGYAGGSKDNADYRMVSSGATSHKEVVQIYYDTDEISFDDLLDLYWKQIDPTDAGGQFADRGSQYQTAIYYYDEDQKKAAIQSKKNLESSKKFKDPIVVPVLKAPEFYPAEEYHQDYYKKEPVHYKRYKQGSGRLDFIRKNWKKETDTTVIIEKDMNEIKKKLTPLQFEVTQNEGTEPPFRNEYWDNKKEGIYVDIVSGAALFSSTDKFKSGSGWPSFVKSIDEAEIVEKKDTRLASVRIEVRSKTADSHLGHVFDDGPADRGGLRYCINSAALKFIAVEDMEKAGYGKYLHLFKKDT